MTQDERAAMNECVAKWRDRDMVRYLAKHALSRAKQMGLPHDPGIVDELMKRGMPTVCPVYGIPIIPGRGKLTPNKPSVDRVIPSLGYVVGNVRIISWKANMDKRDMSADRAQAIADYIRKYAPRTDVTTTAMQPAKRRHNSVNVNQLELF